MDMKLAQFWSGRTIPLGWTRWNPFWTLILVLMVAATAGEADGAAGAADHGLSNIYHDDGTLRAARIGKRSTGGLASIESEIWDLEKRENETVERVAELEDELKSLNQHLNTTTTEKNAASGNVQHYSRQVNKTRGVIDDPKLLTRETELALNTSIAASKKANQTIHKLTKGETFFDALKDKKFPTKSSEALRAEYTRYDCERVPNVNEKLRKISAEIAGLASQLANKPTNNEELMALETNKTKERDSLKRVSTILGPIEEAYEALCKAIEMVDKDNIALGIQVNLTSQYLKNFQGNEGSLNISLETEAEVQEKLNKIEANLTRANGEKDAANRELTDVRQALEDARARLANYVEETTTEEPVTGTNGTDGMNGTDVSPVEKEKSGFYGSALFYVVCVVGGVAGLAAFCGLVYLIHRLVKCCRRKMAEKREKKNATANEMALPTKPEQTATTEALKPAADEKKTMSAEGLKKRQPEDIKKQITSQESKGKETNAGSKTTPPEGAQAQSAGGIPAPPVRGVQESLPKGDPPAKLEPPPTQPPEETKQVAKEKEKKEGNAVKDEKELKKANGEGQGPGTGTEKRTQEETPRENVKEAPLRTEKRTQEETPRENVKETPLGTEKRTQEETPREKVKETPGDPGAGTGTGGGDTKKKE